MEEWSNKLDMNKGCFDVSVFGVSKHFFTTFWIIPTHLKFSQYTTFDMISIQILVWIYERDIFEAKS